MRVPDFEPMLATSWPNAFDDEGWWFEIKWDGYRAVVSAEGGKVRARSRRGLDLLGPFPELASLPIPDGVALDGEVVAFDEQGRPSFSNLQRRTGFGGRGTMANVGVNLVVFDVLFAGEQSHIPAVRGAESDPRAPRVAEPDRRARADRGRRPVAHGRGPGPGPGGDRRQAPRIASISRVDAPPIGARSRSGTGCGPWSAATCRVRASRSSTFGSVLVGLHDDEGLRWIGAVGSGFDEQSLAAFSEALASDGAARKPISQPGRGPRAASPGVGRAPHRGRRRIQGVDPRRPPEGAGLQGGRDDRARDLVTWAEEGPASRLWPPWPGPWWPRPRP